MALSKTEIPINFVHGVDTKTDSKQIQIGKFENLVNSVFDTTGQLTKRPGFPKLTNLPNADQTTLTTLNDNLIATGSKLYAYSADSNQWLNHGAIQPVEVKTVSLVKNSANQTNVDSAIAENGLIIVTYLSNNVPFYRILDSVTGQQVVAETALPATSADPRAAVLGRYFILTFLVDVAGSFNLRYIAIPTANPTATPSSPTDITTDAASLSAGYDIVSFNNTLYSAIANDTGGIDLCRLNAALSPSPIKKILAHPATRLSLAADMTNIRVWLTWYESSTQDAFSVAFTTSYVPLFTPTTVVTNETVVNLVSSEYSGNLSILYEVDNTYTAPYPTGGIKTDFIKTVTVDVAGGQGGATIIKRSVGLASKAFTDNGVVYALVIYGETNQPTYFLMDNQGNTYAKISYANGGGYIMSQVLPSVTKVGDAYNVAYLFKDFLAAVNKGTNLPAGTPVNGIYTQTGLNLAKLYMNIDKQQSAEIANSLHLTGGQLWQYDGIKPVELGFHIWPENIAGTTATGAGGLIAQDYFYAFCYEWTDNKGNLHRSAPSIAFKMTTTTGSSTNTLYVPTLRLTAKLDPNPVRIVGYRWSVAQQVYYQFTSITSPVLNNTAVDYVAITDANSDAAILGQTLLYTTGGVIENIAPSASIDSALYKNRLFLINAENRNLLEYSKQVIQGTPVEFSDLLTLYVAPTIGSQGPTGDMTAISSMDDKLIIFKPNAIYYVTGTGPDNTGANNDFTDPIFVTSAVGTSDPNSVVLTPNGLMFRSDKGIWLLGRDLSTNYIGAAIERYNDFTVRSAQTIPGTNQVRFTLNNNVTLMYDYFQNEWATFTNLFAISSTLYQGKNTYLNSYGSVFQEQENTYKDGSKPVLMSFTTGWINLAGLQGYERFYYGHLLGTYHTPFKLNVEIAYNYNPSPQHSIIVSPTNYTPNWGRKSVWGGGGPWGGNSAGKVFEARFFPKIQKCESFQITVQEMYAPSYDTPAGQGLSLSGLNLTVGVKKGTRTSSSRNSFG